MSREKGAGIREKSAKSATWSPLAIAAITLAFGTYAALYYSRLGLALAHYDARAHLVVARRILDSLTPGWQQIGAVWLPLPHVLNMLPVQVDSWYRSGASAIALSVMSLAIAAWALARVTVRTTGSMVAAAAGAALLMLNPNLLYLQSTPMTEPLLIATCLLAIALTVDWVETDGAGGTRAAGWAIVAACMTRYEAWPVCGALIALAWLALLRRGQPLGASLTRAAPARRLPRRRAGAVQRQQPLDDGDVVRAVRILRAGERGAGECRARVRAGARERFGLSGDAWLWPAYAGVTARPSVPLRAGATVHRCCWSSRSRRRPCSRGTRSTRGIRCASATACRSWPHVPC